jgi:hypothetical protein
VSVRARAGNKGEREGTYEKASFLRILSAVVRKWAPIATRAPNSKNKKRGMRRERKRGMRRKRKRRKMVKRMLPCANVVAKTT